MIMPKLYDKHYFHNTSGHYNLTLVTYSNKDIFRKIKKRGEQYLVLY